MPPWQAVPSGAGAPEGEVSPLQVPGAVVASCVPVSGALGAGFAAGMAPFTLGAPLSRLQVKVPSKLPQTNLAPAIPGGSARQAANARAQTGWQIRRMSPLQGATIQAGGGRVLSLFARRGGSRESARFSLRRLSRHVGMRQDRPERYCQSAIADDLACN